MDFLQVALDKLSIFLLRYADKSKEAVERFSNAVRIGMQKVETYLQKESYTFKLQNQLKVCVAK